MLKRKKFRSEKYRRWIASLPCIITKTTGECQCAHIRSGFYAIGMKPDDSMCVPLHWRQHLLQHEISEEKFYDGKLEEAKELAGELYQCWLNNDDIKAYELIASF